MKLSIAMANEDWFSYPLQETEQKKQMSMMMLTMIHNHDEKHKIPQLDEFKFAPLKL